MVEALDSEVAQRSQCGFVQMVVAVEAQRQMLVPQIVGIKQFQEFEQCFGNPDAAARTEEEFFSCFAFETVQHVMEVVFSQGSVEHDDGRGGGIGGHRDGSLTAGTEKIRR